MTSAKRSTGREKDEARGKPGLGANYWNVVPKPEATFEQATLWMRDGTESRGREIDCIGAGYCCWFISARSSIKKLSASCVSSLNLGLASASPLRRVYLLNSGLSDLCQDESTSLSQSTMAQTLDPAWNATRALFLPPSHLVASSSRVSQVYRAC